MKRVLLLGLGWLSPLAAQPHQDHLGRVTFPVSCSASSQAAFNHAMALLHHMTYPESRQEFVALTNSDPACGMAHWGIAMTLFQPLWPTRPGADALARGLREVGQADSIGNLSPRERSFLAQAEAFFQEPASPDYWGRIRRWEAAAERTYRDYPDDPEAAVFYALAHLATTPATTVSREHADRAAAILEAVYRKYPDHPGAMHYLIHANDVPGREHELLAVTRKYETIAPHNPHALHMPTHIYTRLGDWAGVVRGNLAAAEAALAQPAGEQRDLVWDEFPHAVEYLVYAYLQQGDDAGALAQVQRLEAVPNLEPTFKTAFHLSSARARYVLERRDWSGAASLPVRERAGLDWDRFPWAEAVTRFARGLGAAHLGQQEAAEAERARLAVLEEIARSSGEELFARNIAMLKLELAGWIAHGRGAEDTARAALAQAAALEEQTPKPPVTPAPTLPALELLGDLALDQEQPGEALVAFRRSLELYPHRFNSLLGAARAARASGDPRNASAYYRELLRLSGDKHRPETIQEAKAFLNSRRVPQGGSGVDRGAIGGRRRTVS